MRYINHEECWPVRVLAALAHQRVSNDAKKYVHGLLYGIRGEEELARQPHRIENLRSDCSANTIEPSCDIVRAIFQPAVCALIPRNCGAVLRGPREFLILDSRPVGRGSYMLSHKKWFHRSSAQLLDSRSFFALTLYPHYRSTQQECWYGIPCTVARYLTNAHATWHNWTRKKDRHYHIYEFNPALNLSDHHGLITLWSFRGQYGR